MSQRGEGREREMGRKGTNAGSEGALASVRSVERRIAQKRERESCE